MTNFLTNFLFFKKFFKILINLLFTIAKSILLNLFFLALPTHAEIAESNTSDVIFSRFCIEPNETEKFSNDLVVVIYLF